MTKIRKAHFRKITTKTGFKKVIRVKCAAVKPSRKRK